MNGLHCVRPMAVRWGWCYSRIEAHYMTVHKPKTRGGDGGATAAVRHMARGGATKKRKENVVAVCWLGAPSLKTPSPNPLADQHQRLECACPGIVTN